MYSIKNEAIRGRNHRNEAKNRNKVRGMKIIKDGSKYCSDSI